MLEIRDSRKQKFFTIDNVLLFNFGARMGPYGLAVYCALAIHANKAEQVWPSRGRISQLTGMSDKQVTRMFQKLQDLNLIHVQERDGTSHLITLLDVEKAVTLDSESTPPGLRVHPPWTQSPPNNTKQQNQSTSTAGEKAPPANPPQPIQEEDELDACFGPSPRPPAPNGQLPPQNADSARLRVAAAISGWQQARDGEDGAVRAARERLADSGWVPRPERVLTQVVLFMAHTRFQNPPASDGQRKAWYKALREHADQWDEETCADLYARADAVLFPQERDRPSDWRPTGGPWGYTKTMAGLAAAENGRGSGGYVPPGVDMELYKEKLAGDGIK